MQRLFHSLAIITCFLVLLSSCNSSTEHTKYISKDAVGVIGINTLELSKKAAWNVLSGSPLLQDLLNEERDSIKFDIDRTGIDPMNNFFIYAVADQRLGGNSRMMIIVPLKNAETFKNFIKEKFPEAKLENKDKLSFAHTGENTSIGWNKHTAIVALSTASYQDWQYNEAPTTTSNTITILTEEIQKAFALPKEQSLADNKIFSSLIKEAHDLSFWLNYENFANSLPQENIGTAGAVMASQKKLLKDAYVAASLDFEKGKISGEAAYYFNSSLKSVAQSLEMQSINNELLKKVPGSQMNLLMSYHFNPQGLKALADTMGVLPMANIGLQQFYLTLDDVLNAFSGDFLLTVTDFTVKTESKSYTMGGSSVNYTSPVPSFKAVLSFKVKDKPAFAKIMKVARDQGLIDSLSGNLYQAGPYVTVATSDEYVAISNEQATATAFLGTSNANWKIPQAVTGSPYGFYADIKNSIKSIPLDLLYGKEDTVVFMEARNLIEFISAHGGKVEGNRSSFIFEAQFQNKDENSLVQLINFSKKVAEAERKEAEQYEDVIPERDTVEDEVL